MFKTTEGWPLLLNPYEVDVNSQALVRPEEAQFMFTSCCFDRYITPANSSLSYEDIGLALSRIWSKTMTRRDFNSSCVVQPDGFVHHIGRSMPSARRFVMKTKNKDAFQKIHDALAPDYLTSQVIPQGGKPKGSVIINGRSTRMLTLGAVSPLLFLADDIKAVKVPLKKIPQDTEMETEAQIIEDDADEDPLEEDDEEGFKGPKVESPHMKEYKDLFLAGKNAEWMLKLGCDIYRGAAAQKPKPLTKTLFGKQIMNDLKPRAIATLLIRSSTKLRAMFGAIAEQVDRKDEKFVLFAASPWEQMLYTVMLRLFHIRADAVLATMSGEDKEELIKRFNTPLSRWVEPGFFNFRLSNTEGLVLSYYINARLNLYY